MLNKKDIKEVIGVGVILFLITALAAAILAEVNSVTAPIIAENQAEKTNAAMSAVLPPSSGEASFEKADYEPDKNSSVTEIYTSADGCVVMASPSGYGGAISLAVGIDNDGVVTGIEVISQSETAGLGSKCSKDEFKSQFEGKTAGIEVVKQGASGNQIDAISSATVTSKAVTLGVNDALAAAAELKGGN